MNYMIYPYSDSVLPIIENVEMFRTDINISAAIVPPAWSKNIRKPLPKKIRIETDFYNEIKKVDGVIIIENTNGSFMIDDIEEKINYSIGVSKDVICCTKQLKTNFEKFENAAHLNNCKFTYMVNSELQTKGLWTYQIQESVVVGIGNMLRGMDTTNIIVNMARQYRNLGYRVVSISSNAACALLGFKIFPDGIFNADMAFENVVHIINNYFNNIQLLYQPDIILVQFPDAMIKYSNLCPEDYAVKAYILSQALSIDYFILNVPVEMIDEKDYEKISESFKYRFGFELDAVLFEHIQVNDSASIEEERIVFEPISTSLADEYIKYLSSKTENILFLDLENADSFSLVANDTISKLERGE